LIFEFSLFLGRIEEIRVELTVRGSADIMFTSNTYQAMTKDMVSLTGCTEREVQAESLFGNRK